jgi:hypothetical protein
MIRQGLSLGPKLVQVFYQHDHLESLNVFHRRIKSGRSCSLFKTLFAARSSRANASRWLSGCGIDRTSASPWRPRLGRSLALQPWPSPRPGVQTEGRLRGEPAARSGAE